ncbi:nucleotidyltransferase [Sporolactobacillus sp. CPB3-1]|uniref:tRNA(Met) cytidine acetate ligase n=1 Tax=Sporolactobacillus mangiferae TaxID=2940498 RepID=A0ABT0M7X0_9BACL|nr:nucleotidyltransferase [Sporolactobacillus mangiferae]MCL1630957.1 nucleotidyltransferase [Sporolactobacillus mangiferae]
MIIAGIVAEYNPLHNGHLYQLDTLRKQLNPDVTIAVMSGNFLQRGEPSLVSKWIRTRMALEAGIDLVLELPYVFAVGKADVFARGAVTILDRIGANRLIFGSECGRIEPFYNSLSLIHENKPIYNAHLIEAMAQGVSYPNAHAAAYRFIAQNCKKELVDLTQPNNNLGFQYVNAIDQLGSTMIPVTVRRKQTEHNDLSLDPDASIASATSIRTHLLSGRPLKRISNKLPVYTVAALQDAEKTNGYASWERFFPFLKYALLSSSKERLLSIYEMEEGIEHRLLDCIRTANSFHEFISRVKTKRYTWARLQRLCVHILTGASKHDAKPLALYGDPDSARLLGMSQKGQAYLSSIRKNSAFTIISKIRNYRSPMLELDIKAAQIYDYLAANRNATRTETGHPPLRYDQKNYE